AVEGALRALCPRGGAGVVPIAQGAEEGPYAGGGFVKMGGGGGVAGRGHLGWPAANVPGGAARLFKTDWGYGRQRKKGYRSRGGVGHARMVARCRWPGRPGGVRGWLPQ